MTTATVSQPAFGSSAIEFFRTAGKLFSIANRYQQLFDMDDEQLAMRGLSQRELQGRFLAEVTSV